MASGNHEAVRRCPLCNEIQAKVITSLRFAVFDDCPLAASFPLVACETCGFCYYGTPSTAAALDAYYRGNAYYCSAATAGSGGNSPAEQKRFSDTANCIAVHLQGSQSYIFDVGSGKGGLLTALQAKGFTKLHGIDMLPECVDFIRRTWGFAAECGSAGQLPFHETTPDCLIYSHVMEHVLDPRAVLDEAWNRLAKGGVVYIEVPDAARYGESSALPYSELYLEHINHFDLAHLVMLMDLCGFDGVETGSRLLEVNADTTVPCLYGVFSKSSRRVESIQPEHTLAASLANYITCCESAAIFDRLEEVASAGTPLYVWGLSQYAQLLLGQTALGHCAVKAYLDSDTHKQSKTVGGKPVLSPDVLRNAVPEDAVVITGVNYREQMRKFLKEIQFEGQEIVLV